MAEKTTLRFFTSEKLGKTQSITPEGFLLCEEVPIARTGVQLYCDADGIPVESDSQGLIRVHREENEVFSPVAVASFSGKPITNDHPPEKVSPDNWKDYSIGTVFNPRRGDGAVFDNDFLYADLLITDRDAIKDVRDGKREVSAGYDAEYEQIRPGEGRQHLIIGNHVALVEKGRCGPRCSIGDKAMAGKTPAWIDKILATAKTGDEGKLVEELQKIAAMLGETWLGMSMNAGFGPTPPGMPSGESPKNTRDEESGVHVHLHNGSESTKDDGEEGGSSEIMSRLEALERAVAILAQGESEEKKPAAKDKKATKDEKEDDEDDDKKDYKKETKDEKEDEDEDDDKKDKEEKKDTKDRRAAVGDSTSLRATWQELITRAEFLAPGIKHPTFDAKTSAKITVDSMCKFRRRVLDEAMKEDDTKSAIEQVAGGSPKLAQMTCDSVALVYNGASELMRQVNARQTKVSDGFNYNSATTNVGDTVRGINESNKSFWATKAKF